MPKITIINLSNQEILISPTDLRKSVLTYIHEFGIDWMHSCGKKGKCTTCKMIIIEGMENLESLTPSEEKFKEEKKLLDNERLACQAKLVGDITIKVPKQYQLPHIQYTDKVK